MYRLRANGIQMLSEQGVVKSELDFLSEVERVFSGRNLSLGSTYCVTLVFLSSYRRALDDVKGGQVKKKARLTLRVSRQLRNQADALAKAQSLPTSELVRRAISAYLRKHQKASDFEWTPE